MHKNWKWTIILRVYRKKILSEENLDMIYKIMVSGLVQGIGFRPFVAELAES